MNNLKQYRLEMVVFGGGAIGMILEIVGSRVVSPYFGNSLIVWTNLIGVILGSLSAGYYFGGKAADKEATYEKLGSIICTGAFFLVMTAFLKELVLGSIQFQLGSDLKAASFLSILLLFGPVSFLLGMVAPMAAKLKLKNLSGSGSVVGGLYALSTFGSIIGTFAAGFMLIPGFGNSNLLYGLSLSLVLVSVATAWKIKSQHILLTSLIIFLFIANQKIGVFKLDSLADIDSFYNRIIVRQYKDSDSKVINVMTIENAGVQSAVVVNNPSELYLSYTKNFADLDLQSTNFNNVLVIGGGGYTIPRNILERYPDAKVDVVEIDKEITRMAEEYFYLRSDPRLAIFHLDARPYIQRSKKIYDVIIVDAFNSLTPPPHLTTKEFMTELKDHLSENGVVIFNMVTALAGDKSLLLAAELTTLNSVFSDVRTSIKNTEPATNIQNVYVLAYKSETDKNTGMKIKGVNTSQILSDDWSPVEYLTRQYYE